MGNCGASHQAVESWADDGEWEDEEAEASSEEGDHRYRHHHGSHGRTEEHVSEVTIRITRRQLQELMERKQQAHGGGLFVGRSRRPTEQLLADIMNSGEVHHHEEAHWHWKPALQSIPEAVES